MIHTYIGIAYYKNKVNWTFYMTLNQLKSFFFRSESGHEFKWFPAKNQPLNGYTRYVRQSEACVLGQNHFNSCHDSDLRKN